MKNYNEIITKSLIDFEEIKYVMANNNIHLINSHYIKENYFLNNQLNLHTSHYNKIVNGSYILFNHDKKNYLSYKTKDDYNVNVSKMEIVNVDDCIDFLLHSGYNQAFTIEKNVYEYSDGSEIIEIIDILNLGTYIHVKKKDTDLLELKTILNKFSIPYAQEDCDVIIEKEVINKIRRYSK